MKSILNKTVVCCFAVLIIFIYAGIAQACSCVLVGSPKRWLASSGHVVLLKLLSVEKTPNGEISYGLNSIKQSKLRVEKVYKGSLRVGSILTFAQGGGADCIWAFAQERLGTKYLFYLDKKTDVNTLIQGNVCSRSGAIEDVAEDLRYLKKVTKARPRRKH